MKGWERIRMALDYLDKNNIKGTVTECTEKDFKYIGEYGKTYSVSYEAIAKGETA